ncbi:MAG: hypothetical protein KGL67_02935 [Patescibacteria group bacterium]|nr:hypothetical protein [Patescibacteria group bacterium]
MSSKNSIIILRLGLGLVFLSQALMSWFYPQEFKDLIGSSFMFSFFHAIPSSVFLLLIFINDSLLALIILFNYQKLIKAALLWASIYLVLVMLVIWQPIDILEHFGFLSLAVVLYLEYKNRV